MNSERPELSVVIPTHNRRASLLALLGDVYGQVGTTYEVIVVDDCSNDETAAAIARQFPLTRVLRNESNRGPAASRNWAIIEARGAYIVGLDSDVRLTERDLLRRVGTAFSVSPNAAGIAFRLLNPEGADDKPRWCHPRPLERFSTTTFQTSYFSGTAYAFRREAVVAAGLFPEVLFMFYEEVELAYRIIDAGGSIIYRPDLVVSHHAHPVANRNTSRSFYQPRNQILVALACYPWPRAITYLAPRLCYGFMRALAHWRLGTFARALGSAWTLAPSRLAVRAPLQPSTWRRLSSLEEGKTGQE